MFHLKLLKFEEKKPRKFGVTTFKHTTTLEIILCRNNTRKL